MLELCWKKKDGTRWEWESSSFPLKGSLSISTCDGGWEPCKRSKGLKDRGSINNGRLSECCK